MGRTARLERRAIARLHLLVRALFVLLLSPAEAWAVAPFLEIDVGRDKTEISLLAVDDAGRIVVTVAAPMTLRTWNALNGTLLATARLPLDAEGRQFTGGRVRAIALRSDGRQLAAAVERTEAGHAVDAALHILDPTSGFVSQRIPLDAPGISTMFSADGTRVVVCLASGELRIHESTTGKERARLTGARVPCQLAGQDPAGRITAWWGDGTVRVLGPELEPLRSIKLEDQPQIHSIRVAPNGTRVAVAYQGHAHLEVYSGGDLALLGDIVGDDLANEELTGLAWSTDSSALLALTQGQTLRRSRLFRFSESGQGARSVIELPSARYTALTTLPHDTQLLAVAGEAGAGFQVIAANGRLMLQGEPENSVVDSTSLRVDASAARVAFAVRPGGNAGAPQRYFVFGVSDQALHVRLDTVSLDPTRGEPSSDAAQGLARLAAELEILNPVAARDGRTLVAFDRDGVLHWHSAASHNKLLSLFVHPDQRRWIVWTPSGFYESSPGGDELLGWVVPRIDDPVQPADFVRVAALRAHLHRPDIIARILNAQDERVAVAEANARAGTSQLPPDIRTLFPPVVSILHDPSGIATQEPVVNLRLAVRTLSSEPVLAVRAYVQGRQVQARDIVVERPASSAIAAASPALGDVRVLQVPVPPENSSIAVLAETPHARSAPVVLPVRWLGPRAQGTGPKPKLFLLSVGISKYRQASLALAFPAKDAKDLAAAFARQRGGYYQDVEARVLTDEQATRENILSGLAWLRQKAQATDMAVLFLAGHGINESSSGRYYYLPFEADPARPAASMLEAAQVQEFLSRMRGKAVLFLDTCHSGNILGEQSDPRSTSAARLISELSSLEGGVVVFAASTRGQISRESPRWNNGAFTKAAVEGLLGKADYARTGNITVSVLEHYISQRVQALTEGEQTPTTAKPVTVPDFLLARTTPPVALYKRKTFWLATLGAVVGAVALGVGLGVVLGDPYPKTIGGVRFIAF